MWDSQRNKAHTPTATGAKSHLSTLHLPFCYWGNLDQEQKKEIRAQTFHHEQCERVERSWSWSAGNQSTSRVYLNPSLLNRKTIEYFILLYRPTLLQFFDALWRNLGVLPEATLVEVKRSLYIHTLKLGKDEPDIPEARHLPRPGIILHFKQLQRLLSWPPVTVAAYSPSLSSALRGLGKVMEKQCWWNVEQNLIWDASFFYIFRIRFMAHWQNHKCTLLVWLFLIKKICAECAIWI